MYFSIYLHKPIVDVLKCYGDLDTVTNKILALGEEGIIDIMNKPATPDREGATRFDINVTNESYLKLLDTFSARSSHISIRRLLYWFVENEVYNEVGWKIVNPYVDSKREKLLKKLTKIKSDMQKMRLDVSNSLLYLIDDIITNIISLEEMI